VKQGPLWQGQSATKDDRGHLYNAVFKVRRYAPDYAGLAGRDLTPKGVIELSGTRFLNGASFLSGAAAAGQVLTVMSDSVLSDGEAAATTATPPAKLAGTSVEVKDSAGATQTCGLYYVSTKQINLVLPDRMARGAATVTIRRDSGPTTTGSITIDSVAPGLFSMGTSGIGAILGLRVNASGQRSDVEVFKYDTPKAQFVASPIDLGPATDQVYLSLYGTGIRGFSSVTAITATIGGVAVPVSGAAAHSQYAGVDQVNIGPLPRRLAGKGLATLVPTVDGKAANTVTVNIR